MTMLKESQPSPLIELSPYYTSSCLPQVGVYQAILANPQEDSARIGPGAKDQIVRLASTLLIKTPLTPL